MKLFQVLIISFLIFVNPISSAFCQDVTLSWDPSPTAGVEGYNVYYKQGDLHPPFDGTEADQGLSPVDVHATEIGDLTILLTGLTDGVPYYFAVTAYDNDGNESSYSNIVSNSWIPALLAPANGAAGEPIPATFRWETAPSGYDVTYTLYYGTVQSEVSAAGSIITAPPVSGDNSIPPAASIVLATLILIVLSYKLLPRTKLLPQTVSFLLIVFLGGILTACGGGGGGGDSSSSHTAASSEPPTESVLYSVDKGSSDYHQAYNLEPATTYYWKVVATDTQDPNLTYESEVVRFTTE